MFGFFINLDGPTKAGTIHRLSASLELPLDMLDAAAVKMSKNLRRWIIFVWFIFPLLTSMRDALSLPPNQLLDDRTTSEIEHQRSL